MKKLLMFAVVALFGLTSLVIAGTQRNWGTSTGGSWNTPDDTNVLPGQVLIIGSTTTTPTVLTSTTSAVGLGGQTLAQINQSTPSATGQILYCSDCTQTPLVISTGTTTRGSWAGVFISTGSSPLNKPV